MNDLEMYREQLALCDDRIIDALVERNSIVEKIMAYKEEYGMPILQPLQEKKQKRRLEEKLTHNKYQEEIYDVFDRILKNSKRIQARKLFDYNIVLIGFMGAGKTTISDYLSTVFDMEIVEMDQVIEEREEMSIKKNGRVVLLTASPQTIYERVKDSDERPVLKGRKNVEGIAELMEQRREKYEAAADLVVQTDHKSVLQVCEELVQRLTEMEETNV